MSPHQTECWRVRWVRNGHRTEKVAFHGVRSRRRLLALEVRAALEHFNKANRASRHVRVAREVALGLGALVLVRDFATWGRIAGPRPACVGGGDKLSHWHHSERPSDAPPTRTHRRCHSCPGSNKIAPRTWTQRLRRRQTLSARWRRPRRRCASRVPRWRVGYLCVRTREGRWGGGGSAA